MGRSLKNRKNRQKFIFERDGGLCYICKNPLTIETMTLDHLVPRCNGGTNTRENLRCCCADCNVMKSPIENLLFKNKDGIDIEDSLPFILRAYSYYYNIVRIK